MTLNDAILAVTGGPTVNDGLREWFSVGIANPSNYALNDLERAWLKIQVPTSQATTINDLWMDYLKGVGGITPGSLNDMQRQYWVDQTTAPILGPNEHNLTVGNGSSAMGFLSGAYGSISPATVGAQTIEGIYAASNDTLYIEFVGGAQVGTSVTIEVSGPDGVFTCSWVPAQQYYRSIVTPGLFATLAAEVDTIITIEILPI